MSSCSWRNINPLMRKYHDEEWGIPVHDDQKQFEYLMMEAMQCGLSWDLMMKKREIFHSCFDHFDFSRISQYTDEDVERIMNTEGMIRSERKIRAVIHNAECFEKIREQYGSFSEWLWAFTDNKTILYNHHDEGMIPVSNGLSDRIAKELKRRGFRYLGTVTVYSHLQACGMINDHQKDCDCYKKIIENYPSIPRRRYLEKY